MKLAVLVLFLVKVVLANEDELSLPFELPIFGINASTGNQVQCGKQNPGVKCLNGMCCSVQGWCGSTPEYCALPGYCQSQCWCGWQGDGTGTSCSTRECCSNDGKCGTTPEYCASGHCESQCCGWQADGRLCSNGECCSNDGKCGTTSKYCAPPNCQSQCETPPASHSNLSPLLVGLFIFLIVVALVFYRRFANSPMFSTLS